MTTKVDANMTTSVHANANVNVNVHALFQSLAGNKLRQTLAGQMNENVAEGGSSTMTTMSSSFAKKQLEKLGWREGEGLGKRFRGSHTHLKVTKRTEGLGLGHTNIDPALQQSLMANDWWKHSVGDTLAKLGAQRKKKKTKKDKNDPTTKKKKKTTSSSSNLEANNDDDDDDDNNNNTLKKKTKKIYTDEELFAATGGARFGMRAQTQQHGKWKRAESNISTEEEEAAKKKVEWDGMSAPVVVLHGSRSTQRTKQDAVESSHDDDIPKEEASSITRPPKRKVPRSDDETEEERAERKRRKKEKKKQEKQHAEESKGESMTSSINSKKDKKSKKKIAKRHDKE